MTKNLGKNIERFEQLLTTHPKIITFTGLKGVGKSTLALYLYQTIPMDLYEVLHLKAPITDLENLFVTYLGAKKYHNQKLTRAVEELSKEHLRFITIIDNSERMSKKSFEELEALCEAANGRISVILFGDEELNRTILKNNRLQSHLSASFQLDPLSSDETSTFIDFYLKSSGLSASIFTDQSIELIHRLGQGLPGRIAHLSEGALIEAFLNRSKIVSPSLLTHREFLKAYLPDKSKDDISLLKDHSLPETPSEKENDSEEIDYHAQSKENQLIKSTIISYEQENEITSSKTVVDAKDEDTKIPEKQTTITLDSLFYRKKNQKSG